MDTGILFSQMTQLFLMIIFGYVLGKSHIMGGEFDKKLSSLVLNVTMPVLILSSVLNSTADRDLKQATQVFITSVLLSAVLPFISMLIVKIFSFGKQYEGIYMFLHTYSNIGFMGFPIISAVYGEKGILYTAILNMVVTLSTFTIGEHMINPQKTDANKSVSYKLKNLCTPGIICSIAAIVLYIFPIHFPGNLVGVCNSIGGLTSPLAMLLLGSSIASMDISDLFGEPKSYLFAAVKQIAVPMAARYIMGLFISNDSVKNIIFLLILMPSANSAVLFATKYGRNEKIAAKVVLITTLMSVITIPLCVSIVSFK